MVSQAILSVRIRGRAMTAEVVVNVRESELGFAQDEWDLRVQLAACYRIFDYLGWSELIFNHISVKLPGVEEHLLINPFGLAYREVTASNLVKMDLSGNIVGESRWPVNKAGVIIHTAIHAARPDVQVAMHTHTTAGCAIAGLDGGLDSNNFYGAQLWGQIAYHDFEGITLEADEQARLLTSLGDRWIMMLRNHGLLTCGHSVPSAFFRMWTLQRACELQLATMSAGFPIREISRSALERSSTDYRSQRQDGLGEDAFASLQRRIDSIDPSYRD